MSEEAAYKVEKTQDQGNKEACPQMVYRAEESS